MSEPNSPSHTDEQASERASPGESEETECANCGRTFVGDYCPNCGQKAGASVTSGDVLGDFVRELIDIEGGFRATVVGLTIRPGQVLQSYLSGARARLMSPGRYLLASVILSVGAMQGLLWLGILRAPSSSITALSSGEGNDRLLTFFETVVGMMESQAFNLMVTLGATGILALILRRIIADQVEHWGEALATSAFLYGHVNVMATAVVTLYALGGYLLAGIQTGLPAFGGLGMAVSVGYITAVAYCLGSGWRTAVKGAMGSLWSILEASLTGMVVVGTYLFWARGFNEALPASTKATLAGIGGIYLIPLLLHVGVEAYYRLR